MRNLTIVLMVFALMTAMSCSNKNSTGNTSNANVHEVIVKEVLQANSYTYLLVDEGKQEKWIAGPKMVASVGAKYYYDGALEMKNFESKDLNRVFDVVYFVESIAEEPVIKEQTQSPHMESPHAQGRKMIAKNDGIKLEPLEDVLWIKDVYAKRKELNNERIKVQGIVVKVNKEIMNLNWIHIQDGTGGEADCDLTITTKDDKLNVGDTVVCSGTLIQDKDFGHGYSYEVIVENGVFEILH